MRRTGLECRAALALLSVYPVFLLGSLIVVSILLTWSCTATSGVPPDSNLKPHLYEKVSVTFISYFFFTISSPFCHSPHSWHDESHITYWWYTNSVLPQNLHLSIISFLFSSPSLVHASTYFGWHNLYFEYLLISYYRYIAVSLCGTTLDTHIIT